MEPSGRKFNDMELDHNNQPHNPLVSNMPCWSKKSYSISIFPPNKILKMLSPHLYGPLKHWSQMSLINNSFKFCVSWLFYFEFGFVLAKSIT